MAESSIRSFSMTAAGTKVSPRVVGNGALPVGRVPLLGEDVVIDDHEACIVIVFQKHVEKGSEIMKDAWDQANRIFYRVPAQYSDKLEKLKSAFEKKEVTRTVYVNLVRDYFKDMLRQGGMLASSSESIDGDEWFLRIKCDPERLKEIAEYFRYKMPFTNSAYEASEAPGSEPKENANGIPVPGFTEFTSSLGAKEVCDNGHKLEPVDGRPNCTLCKNEKAQKEGVRSKSCQQCGYHICSACKGEGLFAEFRHIDEIRLVLQAVHSLVSFDDMEEQKVAFFHFPVARYEETLELDRVWVKLWYFMFFPTLAELDKVRGFFGEQIAFFFAWFALFNRALMVLALISVVTYVGKLVFPLEWQRNIFLNGFAVFLVIWNAAFIEWWKTLSCRLRQQWGMENWDTEQALERRGYKPESELTRVDRLKKRLSKGITAAYLAIFASTILGLSFVAKEIGENPQYKQYASYIPIVISIVMKIFSFVWSDIGHRLVEWENHRTEPRFNNSLAWTLASVKLFVALFPFASIAFLEPEMKKTCAGSLAKAVIATYPGLHFPAGTTLEAMVKAHGTLPDDLKASDAGFLRSYLEPVGDEYCVSGCYPVHCWKDEEGQMMCHTNCWNRLSDQLFYFYIIQVASAVIMVAIPIVLTKVAVIQEMAKARLGGAISYRELVRVLFGGHLKNPEEGAGPLNHQSKMYTWVEVQAKRFGIAPYAYGSWGGSYGEDFLELMVGYALLACFGLVLPTMAIVGWFSHMFLYRLLAYRMNNVTSRPLPEGSEGIGTWQDIFIFIADIACISNVALATFVMSPMKEWKPVHKFLFFIVAQNGLAAIRTMVDAIVPDKPEDVTGIEDYNTAIERALVTNKGLPWDESTVSREANYSGVRIEAEGTEPGMA